jgi:hypothetical protein
MAVETTSEVARKWAMTKTNDTQKVWLKPSAYANPQANPARKRKSESR